MFPTVGTRRSQGIGGWEAGCGVSASHLAHLIVLSGLTVVPLRLRLSLRLPLLLSLAAVTTVTAVSTVTAVAVLVLRLVLHLGAGMLLRSPPLQSAWEWFRWGEFGVTARCVNTADLDETSHEHDESNTHE